MTKPSDRDGTMDIDARGLADELRRRVRGDVRFDAGSRALYSTDASNYRQVPIGVVLPRDADDVVEAVAAARRFGAPILPRGGGTSLAGQCCNVALVIDMSRYVNKIIDLDPVGRLARVEPGVVLDDLRDAAEKHGLTFGPDPATHNHCTLGGMIGNNSCGIHSLMSGKTDDNVEALDILTYGGERLVVSAKNDAELTQALAASGPEARIYSALQVLRDHYSEQVSSRFPDIPRRVSGYNLPYLLPEHGFHVARSLVGSEGTCAVVLGATVRLVESPPARTLLVAGYPDLQSACRDVPHILTLNPIGLEGMDDRLIRDMRKKGMHSDGLALLPEGKARLLVEFGGNSPDESADKARALLRELAASDARIFEDARQKQAVWRVRGSALGATARVSGEKDKWEGWEDSAVAPERLGDYVRDLQELMSEFGYTASIYGHFGQGCVHTRIDFDLRSREGVERYRSFIRQAADLVLSYGGSLSGEHGDGQSRGELLPKMFGPELMGAFREFKRIWDPDGKMNPGKLVDALPAGENLRIGPEYELPRWKTHFKYPDDLPDGFPRAVERCVGVGECRRDHGGTMCPSYRVTREEMHSTRGRARLLFEMLRGDPLKRGWREEHVREALDLCLACKGCKSDCPVQVDMATYKAEFLSHYYEGKRRPRYAYCMGLIFLWARLGSLIPGLVNFLTQTPGLSHVAKWIAGIDPQREVPRFASKPFKRRFGERPGREQAPKVILWADTFNNHFLPDTAMAAVEVLEAAGFRVSVPRQSLCCGRPLYDFGMLDRAKRQLRQILVALKGNLRRETPIVVLEPSCLAVFRNELPNLFPKNEDAKRLAANSYLLSEFLEKVGWEPPRLDRKAVVHGHCHQKTLVGMGHEAAILSKMGVEYRILDNGCCGMAGSFGFEKGKRDISVAIGEHELLPHVRAAPPDTLIISDGFSCREQIAQTTDRQALHLAQVIRMALREEGRDG